MLYLGTLGFTKPLVQLVLRTVPLQSLLDWLSKPKGPNLVEASVAAAPEKALVLAVTKNMLYAENAPLVGVGLMYKSHTVSLMPFSATYVQLNVWHSACSDKESEDKLTASHLLFVRISEMSDVMPVVVQHPVLLDVASREAVADTGEPMSPLSFRGFRLHTVWTQQPRGELARNVPFPHFLGESTLSLLEYESEKLPQGLRQGQKRALNLKSPSTDHWNIASDLALPLALDECRQRCEARQAVQGLEGRSERAKVFPTEAPTLAKSPQPVAGSSGAALSIKTAHHGDRVLETAHEILARVHTIHLQAMHEMGSMQELDRTLACTLMAEFARLQLITGEDLTKSLIAFCTDLENSCEVLSSDLARTLNLHPNDPVSRQVKAIIQKFQQSTSIKMNLPLMELGAAREDMEGFLRSCLREISSQWESRELIEELSWKLSAPELDEQAVFQRVMVGLAMDQPLEANFFPGILEGLAGRLGLMPPGVADPPTSAKAGVFPTMGSHP